MEKDEEGSKKREEAKWEKAGKIEEEEEWRKRVEQQRKKGTPGSSTDKPSRNTREQQKGEGGIKELQDLYSRKQWLQESAQPVEKAIERLKQR